MTIMTFSDISDILWDSCFVTRIGIENNKDRIFQLGGEFFQLIGHLLA